MNTHITLTGIKKASITLFSAFCLLLFSFSSPPLASAQSVIATIPFNSRASLLAVNPVTNRIYVVNDDIPGIGVIDGSTNTVLTEIPTGGFQVGIAVNPQTNTVYVAQQFALTINVIDGATNQSTGTIAVGGGNTLGDIAINPVTNMLYVLKAQNTDVSVLDLSNNTQVGTINIGVHFTGLAVDTSTNHVYAVDQSGNHVYVFDGTNNTLITSIPVGLGPLKVAVNSVTHQVYVVNNADNTVSVIDGNTNMVIATVPTDQSPLVAAVNTLTNRVYVGNNGSTDVTIIDGATNTFVENLQVGFLAPYVGVNPITNRVYVGTDSGHNVVVIQDTQPTQLTALSPAKVWIGLKNSDDVGTKFDLLAEVYKNGVLVSSGQLNSVSGGSSGFNNAHLQTIPFTTFSPVDFPQGSQLSMKLYVRNTCTGPTHNSGTARLWFNDAAANSLFNATIGTNANDFFLRDNFVLTTTVGTGPKKTIDVAAGAPCSSFKVFGTWTITP